MYAAAAAAAVAGPVAAAVLRHVVEPVGAAQPAGLCARAARDWAWTRPGGQQWAVQQQSGGLCWALGVLGGGRPLWRWRSCPASALQTAMPRCVVSLLLLQGLDGACWPCTLPHEGRCIPTSSRRSKQSSSMFVMGDCCCPKGLQTSRCMTPSAHPCPAPVLYHCRHASSCCIAKPQLEAQASERIRSAPGEWEPRVLRPGPRARPGLSAKGGAMGPSASGDGSALASGRAPRDAGTGFLGFSHRVGPVKGPIRCTLGLGICRQPASLSHRPIYGRRRHLIGRKTRGWWPEQS